MSEQFPEEFAEKLRVLYRRRLPILIERALRSGDEERIRAFLEPDPTCNGAIPVDVVINSIEGGRIEELKRYAEFVRDRQDLWETFKKIRLGRDVIVALMLD